jgi:hypothetical protein
MGDEWSLGVRLGQGTYGDVIIDRVETDDHVSRVILEKAMYGGPYPGPSCVGEHCDLARSIRQTVSNSPRPSSQSDQIGVDGGGVIERPWRIVSQDVYQFDLDLPAIPILEGFSYRRR